MTGNLGYIGPVLCRALLKDDHEVVGLDSGLYAKYATGPFPKVDQIIGDIRSATDVRTAVRGCDAVIHLAGMSNDPLGELDPQITKDVNFRATMRLADVVGGRPFIFYSSASVYGANQEPCSEDSALNPLSLYAEMKAAVEEGLSGRPRTLVLRNGTVHGPSDNLRCDLLVNAMVASAVTSKEVVLTADPRTMRPVVDVRDLATVTSGLLGMGTSGTFNVASENVSVGEVAEIVAQETGARMVNRYVRADPRNYSVNTTRLRALAPWPWYPISIGESIDDLVDLYHDIGLTENDVKSLRFHRLRQHRS